MQQGWCSVFFLQLHIEEEDCSHVQQSVNNRIFRALPLTACSVEIIPIILKFVANDDGHDCGGVQNY